MNLRQSPLSMADYQYHLLEDLDIFSCTITEEAYRNTL